MLTNFWFCRGNKNCFIWLLSKKVYKIICLTCQHNMKIKALAESNHIHFPTHKKKTRFRDQLCKT